MNTKKCSEHELEVARLYRQTPAYKEAQKRYRASRKGIVTTRTREETPKYRELRREYSASEAGKVRQRQYEVTEKGKATHAKAIRKYRATDRGREVNRLRDKARAQKPTRKRKLRAAWKRYNKTPGGRARYHNRNALKRMNNPEGAKPLSGRDWLEILTAAEGRCFYCGKKPRKPTMDHRIPLSKGGPHSKDNIVVACLKCNLSKGAKIVTLF